MLAGLSRQSICVRAQPPRPVLDLVIVLGEGLDPAGENPFRLLESLEPLTAVVVCPQNDLLTQDIVAEVLKGWAVVLLSPVEDLGEEGDGPILTINDLANDSYIRGICSQNAGMFGLGYSKVGVCMSALLSLSNDSCVSSVQVKVLFLRVRRDSGSAILAKSFTNRL